MLSYIVLVWDTCNKNQTEVAQLLSQRLRLAPVKWETILDHAGVRALYLTDSVGSSKPQTLHANSGVLLGTIFRRNPDPADPMIPSRAFITREESIRILESQGRDLVNSYWGNYVAVLLESTTGKRFIIKDPTGVIPCFGTTYRGVKVLFSRISDCDYLQLPKFSVNWKYIIDRVADGGMGADVDALNEVCQVFRGECVEIDPQLVPTFSSRTFYWTPLTFPNVDQPIEHAETALRSMRTTIRSCIHAWAACHDTIIVRTSGGLDSSVVLGCLADAPAKPRLVAYTYYDPQGRSDPRPWARLAVDHVRCEHVEEPHDPRNIHLEDMLALLPSAEVLDTLEHLQREPLERLLARGNAATAILDGDGGDNCFGSTAAGHALDEFVRLHGLGSKALRIATDVALLKDLLVWNVLAQAITQFFRTRRISDRKEWKEIGQLVTPEIQQRFFRRTEYPHPWFKSLKGVPWKEVLHVPALLITPESDTPFSPTSLPAPEIVHPLYSQPIVELCMRIPLYVRLEDGRDRGLARRAFSKEVPQPILNRQWKDRSPGFIESLMQGNLRFIREMLLDGVLVKEGLLNRKAVEESLSGEPRKAAGSFFEAYRHAEIEAWLRQWNYAGQRVTA